ncbi:LysM peptidoglycan-binding domain-containing protein [Nocardioides zeae]
MLTGATAAAFLLCVLALPPVLLTTFIGNPWPASGVDLREPVGTDVVLGLLAAVVWALWTQLLVCVVVEVRGALTHRSARRIPFVLGVQQAFVRRLVHAVLATAALAPTATGVAHAGSAVPAASEQGREVVTTAIAPTMAASTDSRGEKSPDARPSDRAVVVQRLDSLWSIAERELGSGERWFEIAALNDGRMMVDGTEFRHDAVLRPGWSLLLPETGSPFAPGGTSVPSPSTGAQTHVVAPGDTLSDIAAAHFGDAARYPELYDATRHTVQPGGARLTDPDHIEPGWTITLPDGPADESEAEPEVSRPEEPPPSDVRPDPSDPPRRAAGDAPESRGSAETAPVDRIELTHSDDGETEDGYGASQEITTLRALLATTTLLAAGSFAALAVNRARQARHRRPGRAVRPVGEALGRIEHELIQAGEPAADDVLWIDRAMRQVAAECADAGQPVPDLAAAALSAADLTLRFAATPVGPAPGQWKSHDGDEEVRWVLRRTVELPPSLDDLPAPYPALVSIGRDRDGRIWMLDLEAKGGLEVVVPSDGRSRSGGSPVDGREASVDDVVRFVVAELALNRWAEGVEILVADGLGTGVVDLDPRRVRLAPDRRHALTRIRQARQDAGESVRILGRPHLEVRFAAPDSSAPVVAVLPSCGPDESQEPVEVGSVASRSRGVVVRAGANCPEDRARLEIVGAAGRLPVWDLDLAEVFALTEAQADAIGEIIRETDSTSDVAAALASTDARVGAVSKADGSLRDDLTEPRRWSYDDEGRPRDLGSLLPDPDSVYVEEAATTPEDIGVLAPHVDPAIAAEIEALDPGLTEDLRSWFDADSPRPKVRILGPVEVESPSGETVRNVGGTTEFIVYLACQERGATAERAAVALEWSEATVHNRARDARRMLGRGLSGEEWLPDATRTEAARKRGVPTYQLHQGVLLDADLFRRLRVRAQARGADGIPDLVEALKLVEGRPFDALRRRGYGWLFAGEPLHHHLSAAVVDVAHLVVTRSLAEGDPGTARFAAEVGIRADPESEIPRLDLAASMEHGEDHFHQS